MATGKQDYIVLTGSRVRHGGELHRGGDELSMTEDEAKSVAAHVELKADAEKKAKAAEAQAKKEAAAQAKAAAEGAQ